jgi:hypothetical protein
MDKIKFAPPKPFSSSFRPSSSCCASSILYPFRL